MLPVGRWTVYFTHLEHCTSRVLQLDNTSYRLILTLVINSPEASIEQDGQSLVRPIDKTKYDRIRRIFSARWSALGGLSVHSDEPIDLSQGGEIAAANHDSWWDPWAMAEAYHQVGNTYLRSMAKEELWKKRPIIANKFGDTITDLGGFPVKRRKNFFDQPVAIANVAHIKDNDEVLMMFPQGTRKNHNVGEIPLESLENGIGFIAVKFGLPIRAIGVRGTAEKQFAHAVLGQRLDVKQEDFDPRNRREFVEIGRGVVQPMIVELQELMHEAAMTAEARRNEIVQMMPPYFLKTAII